MSDLRLWQDRFSRCQDDYADQTAKIDQAWAQYEGDVRLYDENGVRGADCTLMRNFTFELIESQIDTSIPLPKVTAPSNNSRKKHNAKVIEAMLKDYMKRVKAEEMNDRDERICKVFGAAFTLIFWDEGEAQGRPTLKSLHPKQVIPQSGIRSLDDMDYVFVTYMQTKRRLKTLYDVDLDENETDDVVDTPDDAAVQKNPEELIEQISAYYRNDDGGIGLFSWAGNTVLADMDSFNARSERVCKRCGKSMRGKRCECGSTDFRDRTQDYEQLPDDILLSDGKTVIPGMQSAVDDDGNPIMNEHEVTVTDTVGKPVTSKYAAPRKEPTRVPYYVPKSFPILIRKNISGYNSFLGDGDTEKIRSLQIAHNKLATKLQEKLLKGGSVLTMHRDLKVETSDRELKVVRFDKPDQISGLGALNLQPDVSQDFNMLNKYYEDAKSTLGITDSYQGKQDATAQSGVARQAAIQQAAGRLQSKIKMKNAYYENLYRTLFQYMLAYADDTRVYRGQNEDGAEQELVFNRYNFLEQADDGTYYYDDDYLFEIDSAAALTSDRQTMWQEIRTNYQSGVYGQPGTPDALLEFWRTMDAFDYPLATGMVTRFEQQAAQLPTQADQMTGGIENG